MDAIQQLKVALLGSAASGLIDLLAERLQLLLILTTPNVQHPQAYYYLDGISTHISSCGRPHQLLFLLGTVCG